MSTSMTSSGFLRSTGRYFLGLVEGAFGILLLLMSQVIVLFSMLILKIDTDVYEGVYSFAYGIVALVLLGGYVLLRSIGRSKNDPYIYHNRLDVNVVVPVIILSFGIMGIVLFYFVIADQIAAMFQAVQDEMDVYNESVDRYSDVAPEVVPAFDNWLNLIAVCILVPIIEELTFRGILLGELLKKANPILSIITSALVFGLMHGISIQIGYALICGIFIGIIYYYAHSIWATILFHALFNFWGSGLSTLLESGIFGDVSELNKTISDIHAELCVVLVIPSFFCIAFLIHRAKANKLYLMPDEEATNE